MKINKRAIKEIFCSSCLRDFLCGKKDAVIIQGICLESREEFRLYTEIIKNLRNLVKSRINMLIRVTIVPGFNDTKAEKEAIHDFIQSLDKNSNIEYLKYHEYGKVKYDLLGKPYGFEKNTIDKVDLK